MTEEHLPVRFGALLARVETESTTRIDPHENPPRAAAAALPAGSAPYAVHFGLNEDDAHDTEPATWDRGPARAGAAVLTASAIHLRGPAGEALDVALTHILGAVHSPQAPWLADGSLDVHLHAGEAIELRTPQHRHLATELAAAGVRVLRA